ncbi:MAG: family 20 glycosylhydrolase [Planctomycetia bacterium]|nr:family 20 glycosylhydrolase [Planctomycetia bacterium]
MPAKEADILLGRLVPPPQKISMGLEEVKLDNQLTINVELGKSSQDAEVKKLLTESFKNWFHSSPQINILKGGKTPANSEGYTIDAQGKTMTITASGIIGVRYALQTLRQLAEVIPGTKTTSGYIIPNVSIEDAPAMSFRGLHLCWFPETDTVRMEQAIRLAAYYKMNCVVLEFWGNYPYKAFPELAWTEPGRCITEKDVRKLVQLGHELGVDIIPQFNLFGHASQSRGGNGKHSVLDFHPEFAPLFEPDGWSWCLSNPETRKVLSNIILELIELYDHPKYFHVGCDEAWTAATCKLCRKCEHYDELFLDHLLHIQKLLAKNGARPLIWHDMFLQMGDERWRGYTAFGTPETSKLMKRLPKEFVICDWQYGAPKKQESWPTMRYFKENSFDVIASPWERADGIKSQSQQVIKEKYFGALCTTWHHFFGRRMKTILVTSSCAFWGTELKGSGDLDFNFQQHLLQVGWEIKDLRYNHTGTMDYQVAPQTLPGVTN